MRHVRFTEMLQATPTAVQGLPAAFRRTSPRSRLVLSALGVAAAVGVVWYLAQPGPAKREEPPPPVNVAKVIEKNISMAERTIGTVVANATVNVTSQVAGQVMSANFLEGQIVHRGDVLFQLDPRPFQAALDQAHANLARDEAQLVAAFRDRSRFDTLAKEGAISAQQHDQATAQAGAMAGTVKADKAAIAIAELNLAYAAIRAPVDGKTGAIQIQPGNLVKANDTNPLVVLTQIQPIKVSFFLPQTDLPRIQTQMQTHKLVATVTAHGDTRPPLKAPVDFVGNAVNAQTGTIELRATFPNEDSRLVPGELVEVNVGLNELRGVTVVPSEAVNNGPNGPYVYVVDAHSVAAMRPVTVLYDDGTTSAIEGKVHRGETVITIGQLRVEPGKAVEITGGNSKAARDTRP